MRYTATNCSTLRCTETKAIYIHKSKRTQYTTAQYDTLQQTAAHYDALKQRQSTFKNRNKTPRMQRLLLMKQNACNLRDSSNETKAMTHDKMKCNEYSVHDI